MKQSPIIIAVLGFVAALGLAARLSSSPQLGQGKQDAGLSVLMFGEARTVVSKRMFELADRYYHSGVEIDYCEHGLASESEGPSEHAPEHEHEHERENEVQDEGQNDWWCTINRHRVPSDHRHLHGERDEKELLPWMWAAVKSDPKNVLAAEVAAYWLASRMKQPEKALELLSQGIRGNPAAFELEISRGMILFHDLEKMAAAERAFLAARRKYLVAHIAWQEQLPETRGEEPERLLYARILSHLGRIREAAADTSAAIDYYREALDYAKNPDVIRRHLHELEQGNG